MAQLCVIVRVPAWSSASSSSLLASSQSLAVAWASFIFLCNSSICSWKSAWYPFWWHLRQVTPKFLLCVSVGLLHMYITPQFGICIKTGFFKTQEVMSLHWLSNFILIKRTCATRKSGDCVIIITSHYIANISSEFSLTLSLSVMILSTNNSKKKVKLWVAKNIINITHQEIEQMDLDHAW